MAKSPHKQGGRDSYAGLLERPGARSSLARQRRRRRRTALIGLTVAAAAIAIVGVAGALFGRLDVGATRGRRSSTEPAATGTSAAASSTAALATAPASASKPGTATAAAPAASEIEIGWIGDTTPGSKYGNPPNAGRALFTYTRKRLTAPDIMIANLEGTFGNGGPSKCDGRDSSACYAFQAPPANAASLAWAGIDLVNLANNHSNDYFAAGLRTTRTALAKNGIAYTGLRGTIPVREVDGVKVAFLGFSPYSWSPGIGDLSNARALVREADTVADVVVVLMHAGAEGADKTHTPTGGETAYGEFRGDSRAFSHAVIDAGADVVLGSGPHVVRGMEQYRGRLIAYSLGNFAGWKNFGRSGNLGLSGLLTVRVAADGRVLGGKWTSLRITNPGVPKVDSSSTSLALVRRLSGEDFATPVRLNVDGTFAIGAK